MRQHIDLFLAPLLAAVLSWTVLAEGEAQTGKWNRSHTFAPLPALLQESGPKNQEPLQLWEEGRREEILQLFRDHVYGSVPDEPYQMHSRITYLDRNALDGTAVQKEVEVTLQNGEKSLTFTLLLFLPRDTPGPVPLFLGLNFYGNQTIHPDDQISLTDSWVDTNTEIGIDDHRATEASRGTRSQRWPV
jgi:hypothetical protein